MKTIIITDSCSDLPLEYVNNNHLHVLGLSVFFKGKEFQDDLGKTLTNKDFYEGVRSGDMPSTSQINVQTYLDTFRDYVLKDTSIIYLGLSSGLSGSLNSSYVARESLLEEYPNADITIIDTKSVSLGLGLIVYYANEMLKKGAVKQDIIDWVENNKLKVNHWFTVDDLNHLKRGGRVSSTAATIGTLLNIKPILQVDDEGHLIPTLKAKGRKKSLRALVDIFKERAINPKDQVVFISHGDSEADALLVKEMILTETSATNFMINPIGPVIGSHSGPGTIALFFIGEKR
ncbi:MAG: DegV family protein [Clostridiaceae bacterium]|nr:DegV family protein [Clostridiaceae bacterium]